MRAARADTQGAGLRILYVTDGFPYPLTSGLLRHYHFVRELSQRHEVTLLSLVERALTAEQQAALQPFVRETIAFPFEPRPGSLPSRALRRLAGGNPYDSAVEQMGQVLARSAADAVLFSGSRTPAVLRYAAGTPVVSDLCDSTWVRIRSRLATLPVTRWPTALLYYSHARNIENHLIRRSAHVLLASPRDRAALGRQVAGKASVVPNGVDLEYWRRGSRVRGTDTIVFTGAMHYRPNVDAALYLIEHILPDVRRSVPDARLVIVGRDPAPALQAAARLPGITITGFVPDMRPYLEQAAVFAAPIRFGAGIQNKLLEAMAMELPVVASSIAGDGLRTEAGDSPPIAEARDRESFVRELIEALRQAKRDPAPQTDVRCYVERHFPWRASGEALENVLSQVANHR
jgi:polysaccharide biosynthesis protein PslH